MTKKDKGNLDLGKNLQFTFSEAKSYYNLHLQEFDGVVRKINSLILANSILISIIIANSFLLKTVLESNYIIVLTFILGMVLLFGSLFFSLLSLGTSKLKLPTIESIYAIAMKHSNLNLLNAVTREYIKDINYNSEKYLKKTKLLYTSITLLKIGLFIILLDILLIIVNSIG